MNEKEPKYQVGTKVIVCQYLKTEIEKIEFSEKYQEYIYSFRDEKGELKIEMEYALEDIIDVAYKKVYEAIDDTLYDLLAGKEDEEFYMDYKEAFTDIVNRLQQDINPTD